MTSMRSEWNHSNAYTRGARGPDALEYVAVAFISLAVMTAVLPFMRAHVRVVRATETLVQLSSFRVDMTVRHALYGRWPDSADPAITAMQAQLPSHNVRSATLRPDAVVSMTLRLGSRNRAGDVLDFRPVLLGTPGAYSLMFLCGHAQPPSGAAVIFGTDHTTLAENDLPFACRGPHR